MKTILRLLKEMGRVKGIFLSGLVIFVLSTAVSQLSPFVLKQMIDGPLAQIDKGNRASYSQMLYFGAFYMALVILGMFLTYLGNRLLIHGGNRITENLRNQAYDVMQRLPISYFDDKPAGKIATRIVNDTETLRNQFYSMSVNIFINLARIVFIYALLFYMNPGLAVVLLLLIPAFYALQLLYKRLTDQPIRDFYDARSEVNTQVNEMMHGSSLIQLYGQEAAVLEDFERTTSKMSQADKRIVWADSLSSWPLTELMKHLVIAMVLTIAAYQYFQGSMGVSAGLLFINMNYIVSLFDMMGNLVRQLPNIQRSLETGRRVLDLLDQEQEEDAVAELRVRDGQVVFDHVSFAYEPGKPVLKDIFIQADKGETIALIGHTGSGKSSIMNLLYRFYDPQEGRILIDGQNISQYSRESLRSQMGIVLQDPYLFTGTIASNVAMSQSDINRERVAEALKQVGAQPMLDRFEKGIDEPVIEKGSAFSSGERQLISFARTLYANPKILILDEATSHIDTETEEIIQQAMEVVKKGRTSFIIAHRLSTIQNADKILVLSKGRIVEQGRHEELLALEGIYAQMSAIQQKV